MARIEKPSCKHLWVWSKLNFSWIEQGWCRVEIIFTTWIQLSSQSNVKISCTHAYWHDAHVYQSPLKLRSQFKYVILILNLNIFMYKLVSEEDWKSINYLLKQNIFWHICSQSAVFLGTNDNFTHNRHYHCVFECMRWLGNWRFGLECRNFRIWNRMGGN